MKKTLGLRTACGQWVAMDVRIACSFGARARGLLGKARLEPCAALLLSPAASVHTLGMRFPIDIVFLNPRLRILALAPSVTPWRVCRGPAGTGRVLELPVGQIERCGLLPGMFLQAEYLEPDTASADAANGESGPVPQASPPGARSEAQLRRCNPGAIQFSLRLPLRFRPHRPQQRCADRRDPVP